MRLPSPRIRNPFRRTAPPLATGAPGHPMPAEPRRSGRTPVPGVALHGAPGRSISSGASSGRAPGTTVGLGPAYPAWELVAVAVALAAVGRLAEGPALWAAASLAGVALGLAALEVVGPAETPAGSADLGIPVESLLLPAVAGIAAVTALHLVPVGLLLVPGLVAVGAMAASTVEIERRILARPDGPTAADRTAVLGAAVMLAFLAFAGIAAAIPGALAEPPPRGAETSITGLPLDGLALLALLDGLVVGILGYRLGALRTSTVRGALASALTYGAVIAIAAAALRAMGIPRLLGPALLTLVLYLWSAYRGVPRSARHDARWIWEVVLLAALGTLVVAWNLFAQG
jgi:hypothetical protein